MDDNTELLIEQRLSVFSDEPDLNDWFEVMCGAAMAVLGLFHLVEPGELVDPDMMRWFAASVIAAGASEVSSIIAVERRISFTAMSFKP